MHRRPPENRRIHHLVFSLDLIRVIWKVCILDFREFLLLTAETPTQGVRVVGVKLEEGLVRFIVISWIVWWSS